MEQEIEIIFVVNSDFFDGKVAQTLLPLLNEHKLQEHATLEIIELLNTKLKIKINTSIQASWPIKKNHRWAHAIWAKIFKPFGKEIVYGLIIESLKEEAEIYGNK